jgi:choline dehydrogenase-like flavoprotein
LPLLDEEFHHLNNVYVFDGSVFSTHIGVKPQESIYALSLRQTECLLKLVFNR